MAYRYVRYKRPLRFGTESPMVKCLVIYFGTFFPPEKFRLDSQRVALGYHSHFRVPHCWLGLCAEDMESEGRAKKVEMLFAHTSGYIPSIITFRRILFGASFAIFKNNSNNIQYFKDICTLSLQGLPFHPKVVYS